MEVRQVGPGGSAILTMVLTMLVMDQPNRPLPCFLSLCLFLFWGGGPANRHDSNDTITGDHNPGYDLSRAARVPSRSSQIDEASWGWAGVWLSDWMGAAREGGHVCTSRVRVLRMYKECSDPGQGKGV
jgi:hypothetical protein